MFMFTVNGFCVSFVEIVGSTTYGASMVNINPLSTKLYLSKLKTQFVPRRKLSASVIKPDKLVLYREIIAVCSQIHTKHINALWAEHRISEC